MPTEPKFKQAKSAAIGATERLRMLRDRILVRPIEVDRHSGLVVIDGSRKCIRGEVVAVGPGRRPIKRYKNERGEVYAVGELPGLVPTELEVGQIVELSPQRYLPISVDGVPHLMAKEEDVAGVIP